MEFGKQVKTNYTVDKEKLLDTFDRAVLTNSRIWLVSIQGKHFMKSPKTLQKYNKQEKTNLWCRLGNFRGGYCQFFNIISFIVLRQLLGGKNAHPPSTRGYGVAAGSWLRINFSRL